jgi:hypothetical protein
MTLTGWQWLGFAVAAIAVGPLALWLVWRGLIAAISSRCPQCGRRYHSRPVCGDRRYERWHCGACDHEWVERYDR